MTHPNDIIAKLAEKFPLAFHVYERRRKPLAIGIHKAIKEQCPELTEVEIKQRLRYYCNNGFYLKACCVVGANRIDLAGQVVGQVTEDEAENSRRRLAWKQAKRRAAKVEPEEAEPEPPKKRLSLGDLRQVALRRKEAATTMQEASS